MRGLPYPLHIAPFVIVEICAQKDVVGEAVVIGFQFPLPLGWNAPLPLHAARCTCGSSVVGRSEEHTSELQSLMRSSYAVFCLKKKNNNKNTHQKRLYQN